MKDLMNKEFLFGIARCSSFAVAILLSNPQGLQAIAGSWKPQELALMALARCLATGDHMNRKEVGMFVAQIVEEQSGQFQNVYDSLYSGVDKRTYNQISRIISDAKGCRRMLSDFAYSEPNTEFKQSILYDQIIKGVSYPDDD